MSLCRSILKRPKLLPAEIYAQIQSARPPCRRRYIALALDNVHQEDEPIRTIQTTKIEQPVFEDSSPDYKRALDRLDTASTLPSETLQRLLSKGSEEIAIGFLQELEAQGTVIPDDVFYEEYAFAQLATNRADKLHAFLRWFQFAPPFRLSDQSTITDQISFIKERAKGVERQFLLQAVAASRYALTKAFVLLTAQKGWAAFLRSSFEALARIAPPAELSTLFEQACALTQSLHLKGNDVSFNVVGHARHVLRKEFGTILRQTIYTRAHSKHAVEAAAWLLECSTSDYHLREAMGQHLFRQVLVQLDSLATDDHVVRTREKLFRRYMQLFPDKAQDYLSRQPVALNFRSKLNLSICKTEIDARKLLQTHIAQFGAEQVPAKALADYLTISKSGQAQAETGHLFASDMMPSESNVALRQKWTAAFMMHYLQIKKPKLAIQHYAQHCLSSSLLPSIDAIVREKQAGDGRYPVHWPSKSIDNLLLRAVLKWKHIAHGIKWEIYQEALQMIKDEHPAWPNESRVFQPFLETFANDGRLRHHCLDTLLTMKTLGIQPDIYNWTTVLSALTWTMPDMVPKILARMHGKHVTPVSTDHSTGEGFLETKSFPIQLFRLPRPTASTYATLVVDLNQRRQYRAARQVLAFYETDTEAQSTRSFLSPKLRHALGFIRNTSSLRKGSAKVT